MLDATLTAQLKQYLALLREPITLVASVGDDAKSAQTRELLGEIAGLSDKVAVDFTGSDARRPSFTVSPAAAPHGRVRFAGLPLGHEFTSLVLALLWAGGHPPKVADETLAQIDGLSGGHDFEMYFSLTCHNCPDVVQALTLIGLRNARFNATLIEGGTYQAEVDERGVMAVPAVFKDGHMWLSGKKTLEEIVASLDSDADAKAAAHDQHLKRLLGIDRGGGDLYRAQGFSHRRCGGAFRGAGA